MVSQFHKRFMQVLFVMFTAWFALHACSSDQEEEDTLKADQAENAADLDPGLAAGLPSDLGAGDSLGALPAAPGGLGGLQAPQGGAVGGLSPATQQAATNNAAQANQANQANAAAGNNEYFEYRVTRGDWLSKISGRVYGDVYKWPTIANANPQISNPNRIHPGMTLRIPITGPSSQAFADRYRSNGQ